MSALDTAHQGDLVSGESWLGGKWLAADSGRTFAVNDPATAEPVAEVADLGVEQAREAIEAAARALPAWRSMPARQRADGLMRWYEQICRHRDELAQLLTREQGKPLSESAAEIDSSAAYVRWFAEEACRVNGSVLQPPVSDRRVLAVREPVGVVTAITPWNFPAAMVARKVAPALAAGCTVVVKPAHETPLSALALARLAERAGLPAGVLNVVCGTDAPGLGLELSTHPLVRKLSFTGSTRVGKLLLAQCASTVKKVSMELGGNAPLIVFDDADVDLAVAGTLASKFRNSGQTCISANRVFVQQDIYPLFRSKIVAAVSALRCGAGSDSQTDAGPLISERARRRVHQLVVEAVEKGGTVLCGGQLPDAAGYFYPPSVIETVEPDFSLCREEIFGPVLPLVQFASEVQVIAMANDTTAGLAAYCYTRDMARGWRLSSALDYGMVGINETMISSEMAPFGGVKESGLGREGSSFGIDDYLELKYVAFSAPGE